MYCEELGEECVAGADTLLALAERVEAAGAPDRNLDEEIAVAILWRPSGVCEPAGTIPWWLTASFGIPDYTASLDAAMKLVPGGWHWTVTDYQGAAPARAILGDDSIICTAATPALALTAACLRARVRGGR